MLYNQCLGEFFIVVLDLRQEESFHKMFQFKRLMTTCMCSAHTKKGRIISNSNPLSDFIFIITF